MGTTVDLTGSTFGAWKVLAKGPSYRGNAAWHCVCECSTERVVLGMDLRSGKTSSCGCRRGDNISRKRRTHGMSNHPGYNTWKEMVRRCQSPAARHYALYGGRGITVCEKWQSFEGFWEDMGPVWKPGLSIERIDNNRGYYKGNCRWATPKEQALNRRTNHRILTPDGVMTIREAADHYGIKFQTIAARLRYGWTDPHELVKPPMEKTEYLKQYKKKAP